MKRISFPHLGFPREHSRHVRKLLQSIRTQNRGTLFPAKQSETTVRRLKT